ncbi:YceI family protein [Phenylobacterium sp.]|uniref:YceI family protein n=1 Tax=Phenylobacterium sp. TaxID=1871053 RepID=UPI0027355ED8|nr:YceI family protein [Phenylobacterium sp.]MDP3659746.1 YceI family protein [Phenylobacterium sp.]
MNRFAATLFATCALTFAAGAADAQTVAAAPPAPVAPADVKGGAYTLDASHGKVTWSVSHVGFSTYIGQFTGVTAKLNLDPKTPSASTLEATVDTTTVGTLNAALDTHLKSPDFLDTAKFPTATFKSTSITSTGERTADIAGDLTLHGVTKPVVIKATFNKAGPGPGGKYRVGFDGETVIKFADFAISPKMGAMLGGETKLDIEGEFVAAQ